jgi:hypothetical protein
MHATQSLPSDYQYLDALNLSGFRISLLLNVIALGLLFFYIRIFTIILAYLSPNDIEYHDFWSLLLEFSGTKLIALFVAILFVLVLHELVHGFFFWLFTQARPKFALKSGYAYAAAPGWFFPRIEYIIIGLSPFLVITLGSLAITTVASPTLIPYLLVIATFNAAGSLADMVVVAWVLKQPASNFINDQGDVFSSYGRVNQ